MRTQVYKGTILNLGLGLFGVIMGCLLVELMLRAADISYPTFYTWDPYRGIALRPGAEGWWRREGKTFIRINSDGLRDHEHTTAKPPGTLRIAVLGDSYAEARQVPMEKTFWAVLQRQLENCPALMDRKAEVINFGVSGYGTAQELVTLRRHVWKYSPDVVVLAFTTGNDVSNNLRALGHYPLRPYFVFQNGSLELDTSFREAPEFRLQRLFVSYAHGLTHHLRILQLIKEGMRSVQWKWKSKTETSGQEIGLDDGVYLEPTDPLWEDAWRVTEGLILLIRDEVVKKGAGFLLVTLSNGIQVHPDPSVRRAFMRPLGADDLFYPERRLKALGKREALPVVNLAQDFQNYAERHNVFLHGFESTMGNGHWNAEGHRLGGEMIAQRLCRDVLSARNGFQRN
jgi:hypothetical protein